MYSQISRLSAAFSILVIAAACSTLYPSTKNVDSYQLRARYEQGPCFGRCPVYKLSLYQNGLVVYEGERFTNRPGTWEKLLGRDETKRILDSFALVDMSRFPASFPSRVPDLATKTLAYVDADTGNTYSTSWKENRPDELERLGQIMQRVAESGGFKQASDTIRTGPNLLGQSVQLAAEEIIVHLKAGVNPRAWIVRYGKQNAQLKERISPNGNYYVVLSDPNIMGTNELINFMRRDESVISVQRNRQVTPRN